MTLCPPKRERPRVHSGNCCLCSFSLGRSAPPCTTDSSHVHFPSTQGMRPVFFTPTYYLAQEAGGLNLTLGLPAQRARSRELHARVGVGHPNHGAARTEVRALRLYIPSTPHSSPGSGAGGVSYPGRRGSYAAPGSTRRKAGAPWLVRKRGNSGRNRSRGAGPTSH